MSHRQQPPHDEHFIVRRAVTRRGVLFRENTHAVNLPHSPLFDRQNAAYRPAHPVLVIGRTDTDHFQSVTLFSDEHRIPYGHGIHP